MPIRPIDMQVSIPRLPEVSKMSQLEQQKAGLHQNQGALNNNKANQKENRSVTKSHKDNKSGNETDARKEGRNKYSNKKNNNKNAKKDQPRQARSTNKIDIRI